MSANSGYTPMDYIAHFMGICFILLHCCTKYSGILHMVFRIYLLMQESLGAIHMGIVSGIAFEFIVFYSIYRLL